MNRLPFGIGDFVATFKGDFEGHPFRGNQYDGGTGAGETSSIGKKPSKAQREVLKKMEPVDLQKYPDDMGRITPSFQDVDRHGVIGQFNVVTGVNMHNPIPDAGKFAKGSDGKFYGFQGRRVVEVINPIPHILPNGEPFRRIGQG